MDPDRSWIRNEHPLLKQSILETVLVFCKSQPSFSSLRLICKLWDVEVCKILRPQTEIPLHRLLNSYPEGLGWKWIRSPKFTGSQYQSPYPDTPKFDNIKVTVELCEDIKDSKVIRWFEFVGGQVKSLHYSCALDCYHKNEFLGNCVQTWCPYLESLHLSDIECFASLIYVLQGKEQKKREFEMGEPHCRKLKSLIISVNNSDPAGIFTQCSGKKSYGIVPTENDDQGDRFFQLIEKKTDEHPDNFFEIVKTSKYFNSGSYAQREIVDWGIIGLLLRVAPLEKIIIKKLNGKQQCRDLALFLFYQPSQLRSSLEHLEFQDNVFVGRDPICLKILSLFKCPLKHFRLDNILSEEGSMAYFRDLLESCAGTLKTLEIDTAQYRFLELEIPVLPRLKKFVHRNIGTFTLEGNELLRNCSKLEICTFLDKGGRKQRQNNWNKGADLFFGKMEEIAGIGHRLKQLQICGILKLDNVVQLGKGLGNLIKVNLGLDRQNTLERLLEWMGTGKGKIEDLRVLIRETGYGKDWSESFIEHLRKIKGLKFLEIEFQGEKVFLSKDAFRNGFAKVQGLTSLKIRNFGGISKDDKDEIERILEHIPFVELAVMRNLEAVWFKCGESFLLI